MVFAVSRPRHHLDLGEDRFKAIRKRPSEKPYRRCRAVWGVTIEVLQHGPHRVPLLREPPLMVMELRESTVWVMTCWSHAERTSAQALCLLVFLRAQRVRTPWCAQETLGSRASRAHGLQGAAMVACSTSWSTPAHHKSTSAARAGNWCRTFCSIA